METPERCATILRVLMGCTLANVGEGESLLGRAVGQKPKD
jgi:hypothetical protein